MARIRKFNPKWLVISLVVACVIGGSVGGYFALINNVTPTISIPNPQPVQPNPVPPVVSTPTQPATPNPMPVLNVAWEEIKLPPLGSGYDGIDLISAEDADTISVYRMIGPANGGKATRYGLWKTTDGGKTWNEIEKVIVGEDEAKNLGFHPEFYVVEAYRINPYLLAEEDVRSALYYLIDFGVPRRVVKDPNNPNTIFAFFEQSHSDGKKFVDGASAYRLFLSIEGRWYQINFPPYFLPYDAFPETPQVFTTTNAILGSLGIKHMIEIGIISSNDGSINLFMSFGLPDLWKATIKSPN